MSDETSELLPQKTSHLDPHTREEYKRFYIAFDIALLLAAATLSEWITVEFPWNYWVIAVPLAILSVIKFIGVVTWFMHLRWDHRLLAVIFVSGLLIKAENGGY